jgi:hypothetical protein
MSLEDAKAADIYSFGLLLFYLFTAKTLLDEPEVKKAEGSAAKKQALFDLKCQNRLPKIPGSQLMLFDTTKLCDENPKSRPTIKNVVTNLKAVRL